MSGPSFPDTLSDRDVIALLEAALRDKDDTIQTQYRELAEAKRLLALAQEGVNHWQRLATQHEAAAADFHGKWISGAEATSSALSSLVNVPPHAAVMGAT